MRPFEIILSIVSLSVFAALVTSRHSRWRWLGHSAPLAVLAALTQTLAEGTRWQMIPAYLVAATLTLIWLTRFPRPPRQPNKKLLRWAGIGLGTVGLAASWALPIVLPVFHFREPTGPHAVGTVTYHWVDASRPELFTTDPDDHRELMAQIWYPAKNGTSGSRAPYVQDAEAWAQATARVMGLPEFSLTHFRHVTTNALASAPVADDRTSYPVLVFSSGLDGFRGVNTFQIEELVSRGYVVVGIDQPGAVALVRFPDGREIPGWPPARINPLIEQSVWQQPKAPELHGTPLPDGIIPYFGQDVRFALDQLTKLNQADPQHLLTGRLDLDHTGAFGVSLGGMNVAEACSQDSRLKACLIMDVYLSSAVVTRGLRQPAMFMTRDAATMRLERERFGGWTEKDIAWTLATMRAVYGNLAGDGYFVEIPKMFHVNFTDLPYWSPLTTQFGLTGPIDRWRGFDLVNAYSVAFFDSSLKNQPSSLLNGPSNRYPEVNLTTRQAK
jgi:predicted dienelactone hydrolase